MTLSKTQSTLVKGGLITLLLLLAGCSTKADKSLYNWDNYQTTVYQYYQGDKVGPEEQIASLKESIEKSRADRRIASSARANRRRRTGRDTRAGA